MEIDENFNKQLTNFIVLRCMRKYLKLILHILIFIFEKHIVKIGFFTVVREQYDMADSM